MEERTALQHFVNFCGNVRIFQGAEVLGFVLGQKPRQLFAGCIAHFWGLCVVAREAVNFKGRNLKDQVQFEKKKKEKNGIFIKGIHFTISKLVENLYGW